MKYYQRRTGLGELGGGGRGEGQARPWPGQYFASLSFRSAHHVTGHGLITFTLFCLMTPVVNARITAVVAAGLKMVSVEATNSTKSSETVSLGENPNQSVLPSYPRRKFGLKSPVFRAFQSQEMAMDPL